MIERHLLFVFTDAAGRHGNALGVLVGTAEWSDEACQDEAAHLGHSETVFVDDPYRGRIRIFTPAVRLPFAGHPTVGAGWLLHQLGYPVSSLLTDAGEVPVTVGDGGCTVEAQPAWSPPWDLRQLHSPAAVDAAAPGDALRHDYVWAWIDEEEGLVRARAFASAVGITEDEATGSAAIRLCGSLGRALRIRQGGGSWISVTPAADGRVALSGAVTERRSD